ncbi:MAG: thioredoxin family protein [Acidobacteria bacterium]|nr:thioredoxin family protein [Acidobacteriota bacterium]
MRKNAWKVVVVIALAVAVGLVIANKNRPGETGTPAPAAAPAVSAAASPAPEPKLPKLVDLGAKKCVPCKMMAPILDELAKDFKGKLIVEFIDVWQNPEAGDKYGIQSIPTQIFYDADGKEFFRHEGFYPREEILARFAEKGYRF